MSSQMDRFLNFGSVGAITTQVGLIITGVIATAMNFLLDSINSAKDFGKDALNKGISVKEAVENRIYNVLEAGQDLAMNRTEKLVEYANSFLDFANSIIENIFGLPHVAEDPESTLKERIAFLAGRIAGSLKIKAIEAKQKLDNFAPWLMMRAGQQPTQGQQNDAADNDGGKES